MPHYQMEERVCGVCGIAWSAPKEFMDECRKVGKVKTFYCPNGHPRVFSESEADKVRRELNRANQLLAQRDDEILAERKRVKIEQKKVRKLTVRASAGVCPCCNRSVRQMALHMKNKHPSFKAEALN